MKFLYKANYPNETAMCLYSQNEELKIEYIVEAKIYYQDTSSVDFYCEDMVDVDNVTYYYVSIGHTHPDISRVGGECVPSLQDMFILNYDIHFGGVVCGEGRKITKILFYGLPLRIFQTESHYGYYGDFYEPAIQNNGWEIFDRNCTEVEE